MSTKEAQSKKKKAADVPRKNLVVCFVQDKEKYGEYFLQLESPKEEIESMDAIQGRTKSLREKKLIPALDIKQLEAVDAVSFSIVLHEECLLNCYDVVDQTSDTNRVKKTASTSLLSALGSLMN